MKVIIVVREGVVDEVYSDIETLNVEVIDLDTDCTEREADNSRALSLVEKDYRHGRLFKQ